MAGELGYYVAQHGGPDALLHYGRKRTPQLQAEIYFGHAGYEMAQEPTQGNGFIFAREQFYLAAGDIHSPMGIGHAETRAAESPVSKRSLT